MEKKIKQFLFIGFLLSYGFFTLNQIQLSSASSNTLIVTPTSSQVSGTQYKSIANISWSIYATNIGSHPSYAIYYKGLGNESLIRIGLWDSNQTITQSVSSLYAGSYSYRLLVFDDLGHNVTSYIIVYIQPNLIPTINHPIDKSIKLEDQLETSINWVITDNTVDHTSYSIYLNGTLMQEGYWVSGIAINFQLRNLIEYGDYLYTINATDGLNEYVMDNVLIHIHTINVKPDMQIDGFNITLLLLIFVIISNIIIIRKKSIVFS